MKIELTGTNPDTGATTAPVILCNGAEEPMGPIGDWDMETRRNVQVSQPVRARFTSQFYRGVRSTSVRFVAVRLFANFSAAEAFVIDHERSLPKGGTLKLTTYSGGGGGVVVRTVANCELLEVRCMPAGRTVVISYEFIGGEVT